MSGKYRTIVADPPWPYENNRGVTTAMRRGAIATAAAGNYPTKSLADIAALRVATLASGTARPTLDHESSAL